MYNYYQPCDYSRAISRQDEALEDLMRATRQRKHRPQHWENPFPRSNTNSSQYHHRNRQQVPVYHHQLQKGDLVDHYQYPSWSSTSPPLPAPPAPLQLPREYYSKGMPPPNASKTKAWINKLLSHSTPAEEAPYHFNAKPAVSEPVLSYTKENNKSNSNYGSTDDEIGLLDLKNRKHKNTKQRLPNVKTSSRPTVIPSVSNSLKKVVVIDVPSHTTVIIRNIADDDNEPPKKAVMHHITDMSLISSLLNKLNIDFSPSQEKRLNKKRMANSNAKVGPIKSDLASIQSSHSVSSSRTVTNASYSPPQKKAPSYGIVKYLSMPSSLNHKQEKPAALPDFEYVDSDDSTLEDDSKDSKSEISLTPCSSDYFSVTEEFQKQQQQDLNKKAGKASKANKTKKWIF
ncbi:uncharacterized protein B0P05DRAFT_574373 [Gilbertella persicaria]|uniref:Uncharacterized protein n=1 Tax=Rhizopus stolonifer TaxID=4846 RepID=A0A367J6M9_RHIST|nr:uncharacterized protein B0P05DRAFT_574373 [Gilbertella persicaria]KAI8062770.1 hypothetical protein B0P05DRAFT_574373 [Gilbertella persicaria]RCH85597.1 hypothetical protein CU098_006062 [Rhizopus stolonifer]